MTLVPSVSRFALPLALALATPTAAADPNAACAGPQARADQLGQQERALKAREAELTNHIGGLEAMRQNVLRTPPDLLDSQLASAQGELAQLQAQISAQQAAGNAAEVSRLQLQADGVRSGVDTLLEMRAAQSLLGTNVEPDANAIATRLRGQQDRLRAVQADLNTVGYLNTAAQRDLQTCRAQQQAADTANIAAVVGAVASVAGAVAAVQGAQGGGGPEAHHQTPSVPPSVPAAPHTAAPPDAGDPSRTGSDFYLSRKRQMNPQDAQSFTGSFAPPGGPAPLDAPAALAGPWAIRMSDGSFAPGARITYDRNAGLLATDVARSGQSSLSIRGPTTVVATEWGGLVGRVVGQEIHWSDGRVWRKGWP